MLHAQQYRLLKGLSKGSAPLFNITFLLTIMVVLPGCGGGPSSSSNPPPPQSVTVSVSVANSSVLLGNTDQFTATVTGSSNAAVTWSVGGIAGGNSTVGTISNSGVYTAPADLPNPATITATATSQADTSKSASQSLTVMSDIVVSLATNPPGASSIKTGVVLQLSYMIGSAGRPDTRVNLLVNGVPGGNATVGTITATTTNMVTYTAPGTLPSPPNIAIQIVSVADPTKSGGLTLRVDIPITQFQTVTDSSGIAAFTFASSSLSFLVVDQDTLSAVPNMQAFLVAGVNGNAMLMLNDPVGRYDPRPLILQLPAGVVAAPKANLSFPNESSSGATSTSPPVPIQVTVPRPISSTQPSAATFVLNSVQPPPPPAPQVAFTPELQSLYGQALEHFAESLNLTIETKDVQLSDLQNGELVTDLGKNFGVNAMHLVVDGLVPAGAPVTEKLFDQISDNGDAAKVFIQALEQMIANEVYMCQGYGPSQMFRIRILKSLNTSPPAALKPFDGLVISIHPLDLPAGPSCTGSNGTLAGTVIDVDTKQGLSSALVLATGPADGQAFSAQDGTFNLPNLPGGNYLLDVDRQGYEHGQFTENFQPGTSTPITVALKRIQMDHIQITPTNPPPIPPSTGMQQFTAVALDVSNNPVSPQPVFVWMSNASAVATIDTFSGLAQAGTGGTAYITATAQGADGVGSNAVPLVVEPLLQVTPASLNFSATQGGSNPPGQGLSIASSGAPVSWTANSDSPWLSITTASGTTPSSANASVNIAGLSTGTFKGSLTFTAPTTFNSTVTVPVTLQVNSPQTNFTLTVSGAGSGSGSITSSPSGINCGSTCSASFGSGTIVTLAAAPSSGSVFVGWSGVCSGTGACVVTMNAAASVTATFSLLGTASLTIDSAVCQVAQTFPGGYANMAVTINGVAAGDSIQSSDGTGPGVGLFMQMACDAWAPSGEFCLRQSGQANVTNWTASSSGSYVFVNPGATVPVSVTFTVLASNGTSAAQTSTVSCSN